MSTATKVITVMPGDPAVSLEVDFASLPEEERYAELNARKAVFGMSDEERHHLALDLTLVTDSELVVKFQPSETIWCEEHGWDDESSKGSCFALDIGDKGPLLEISPYRIADARFEGGNVAAAIVSVLREIADEHQEFADRIERALGGHLPWK